MTVTAVLSTHLANDIREAARLPVETAGVLIASVIRAPSGELRLLGRAMRWVDSSAYQTREPDRLSIASHGYVAPLSEAETLGAAAIWFHTHPGDDGSPRPSKHDRRVDDEIGDLFRLRTGSPFYGTLIISPRPDGIAFTGTLCEEGKPPAAIDRLWEVGDDWRLAHAENSTLPPLQHMFDRNVRAFGGAIQAAFNDLCVGIAGCGGTGSAVAEQLVRLGVRHLVLLDPDHLSESNVTRVYGSTPRDVGQPKVEVLRRHLTAIAPDLLVQTASAPVTLEPAARLLSSCDVVFGCTDDNAGRLVLSRLPTYLLTPVIDCGILLSSGEDGTLTGIDGRVTVVAPGSACLVCRNRIDLARAGAELLTPEERIRRADEGYAPALGRIEPAVVAYTTAVAACAVNELIERLTGFGPTPRPGEVLLRLHERHISTNLALPRPGHYCDPAAGKWGLGARDPFLEQLWPTQ
jgi:molybdopterin/thiamine biosynthesis adenylyltransferase/proteasome lid subunit RPN8/RPN11